MSLCSHAKNLPDLPLVVQSQIIEYCLQGTSIRVDDEFPARVIDALHTDTDALVVFKVCKGVRREALKLIPKTLELVLTTPSAIVEIETAVPKIYLDRVHNMRIELRLPSDRIGDLLDCELETNEYLRNGFLTKDLLAPLATLRNVIIDASVHDSKLSETHWGRFDSQPEMWMAHDEELESRALDHFNFGINDCCMDLTQLDWLDRSLTISVDLDFCSLDGYEMKVGGKPL